MSGMVRRLNRNGGGRLSSRLLRFGSVLVACGYALYANAVIIRHDVKDELHQELAQSKEEFKAEGSLIVKDQPIGSVTLIAQNVVLTAAHVTDGDPELESTKVKFDHSSEEYSVKKWVRHPYWTPGTSEHNRQELFMFGFDFALGILDREVEGIKPAVLFDRKVHGTEEKRVITIVSHGGTGNGETGFTGPSDVKRAGTNTAEFFNHFRVMQTRDPYEGVENRLFFTEFKSPRPGFKLIQLIRQMMGNLAYQAPEITELECSFNYGDSGAPTFTELDGQQVLTGICSFTVKKEEGSQSFVPGQSKYGDISCYGAVGAVSEWIQETLKSVD